MTAFITYWIVASIVFLHEFQWFDPSERSWLPPLIVFGIPCVFWALTTLAILYFWKPSHAPAGKRGFDVIVPKMDCGQDETASERND